MRKLLVIASAAVFALPAAAAHAEVVEHCSPPAVFGSYALRACVMYRSDGAVLGYAHISLAAGHSDCTIRGRLANTDGWLGPLKVWYCPRDSEVSFATQPMDIHIGTIFSAFSIRRDSDGNIAPKTTSPTLTAYLP